MYMDDIKLLAKNKKELETLIQAVSIYSEDIGMEFGIEKSSMLIMKNGKTEGIELPNKEKKIRTLTYTWEYWNQTHQTCVNERKIKKRIPQQN